MNFREKYLKYKKKYFLLKNTSGLILTGGNLEIVNIDEDIVISELLKNKKNLGQHNCGIVFIDNYVVKCIKLSDNDKDELSFNENYAKEINDELEGIFPKYYKWTNGKLINPLNISETNNGNIGNNMNNSTSKYAYCVIMQRLDGDLTDFLLKSSYQKAYGNLDNYDFFYLRLEKTHGDYISDYVRENDTQEVKEQKKINRSKQTQIINDVKKYIFETCYSLNVDIIFLHHKMIRKGWKYGDLKIDNIGYKMENNKLKLFFIDDESGLSKISNSNNDFEKYLNEFSLIIPLGTYGILGQYNLRNTFDIDFESFYPKFDKKDSIIKNLVKKKFMNTKTSDNFNWIKFQKNGLDGFFVIQFIMGFYRLVFFDNNGYHMSNPNFNENLPKIDNLYYSIEEIYNLLNDIYV